MVWNRGNDLGHSKNLEDLDRTRMGNPQPSGNEVCFVLEGSSTKRLSVGWSNAPSGIRYSQASRETEMMSIYSSLELKIVRSSVAIQYIGALFGYKKLESALMSCPLPTSSFHKKQTPGTPDFFC